MSAGNDYSFDAYLAWRDGVDYFRDDPLLARLLKHFAGDAAEAAIGAAEAITARASGRWRQLADDASRPGEHPRLVHYDAFDRRVDRIERAAATRQLEREVFGLGLFSKQTTYWQRVAQYFLIYQNGEASIACPLTCTEGLAAMLDRFADTPALESIQRHIEEGIDGKYAIGAQFLSEIQGGSDVNANRVEAREVDGQWRIHGKKFFCSVAHADYALVTARPAGAERLGAFVVPAYVAGEREHRNGQRIERLKWKLGTCELPTAEIEFDGALAYPLGPLEQGLANIVGIVLSASRVTVAIYSAAVITRAAREAAAYARFRNAFGRPIAEFPLLAAQLGQLEETAARTTAGVLRMAKLIADRGARGKVAAGEARRAEFDLRLLIMLQKITTAADSVESLHLAISVFGGHGAIEDFSALPRLLRDSMVNELWEGPRNVLLAQIHRDLCDAGAWYPFEQMLARLLPDANPSDVGDLATEGTELLAADILARDGDAERAASLRFADFCSRLTKAFQRQALFEVS